MYAVQNRELKISDRIAQTPFVLQCNFLDSYIQFFDNIGLPPVDQAFQYVQHFTYGSSPCL